MEIEWSNPIIWGITGIATVATLASIWKFDVGWDRIPMTTRIMISVLTPPVAFFVGQLVINKGR